MISVLKEKLKERLGLHYWPYRKKIQLKRDLFFEETKANYNHQVSKWPSPLRNRMLNEHKLPVPNNSEFANHHLLTETQNQRKKNNKKPHILIVTQKWMASVPQKGAHFSHAILFGTLDTIDIASYSKFYYDEYFYMHQKKSDAALIELCKSLQPDLLFFSYSSHFQPSFGTIKFIKKKLGIPVVIAWWEVYGYEDFIAPYIDVNIVPHSTIIKRTKYPEKYLQMWMPSNPKIFFNPKLERTIPISFVGSAPKTHNRFDERWNGLEALKNNGIQVCRDGGVFQGENFLSIVEFAKILQSSKITLSFGQGQDFDYRTKEGIIPHTKLRIFEATLCGAMLLDSAASETQLWFEPYVDYVPFENEQDLVDKARYFLEKEEERLEIANNGYQKTLQKYTGQLYWQTILERLGFKVVPN